MTEEQYQTMKGKGVHEYEKNVVCTICGATALWMQWGMYECMDDDSHVWDGKSELFQDVKGLNEGPKTGFKASEKVLGSMAKKVVKSDMEGVVVDFDGVHKIDVSGIVKLINDDNNPKLIFDSLDTNPCLEVPLTPLPLAVNSITVDMKLNAAKGQEVKKKEYPLPLRNPKSDWGRKMREILDNKKY